MTLFEMAKKVSGYKTDKAVHRFYNFWKWYICYHGLEYSETTCVIAWNKYKRMPIKRW